MNNPPPRIESTSYGRIATDLRNPDSPIMFVLHLRQASMLVPLADELLAAIQRASVDPKANPGPVDRLIAQGQLRVSPRNPYWLADPASSLDVSVIPPSALCQAVYLPPFCLVHTPGLFEGTLVRTTVSAGQRTATQRPHRRRMRI